MEELTIQNDEIKIEELTIKNEEIKMEEFILGIEEQKDELEKIISQVVSANYEEQDYAQMKKTEAHSDGYSKLDECDSSEAHVQSYSVRKKIKLDGQLNKNLTRPSNDKYDLKQKKACIKLLNSLNVSDSELSSFSLSDGEEEIIGTSDVDSESDTSDSDDSISEGEWNDDGSARDKFEFTADEGLKISADIEADDVLKIYQSITNDEIIKLISDETNKFATKCIGEKVEIQKRSRLHKWTDVTVEEIRLFEGILLLMTIVQKPSFQSYFTIKPILESPIFPKMMKIERFSLILKFLHFSDNTNATNKLGPGLCEIAKLQNLYKQSFQAAYVPSRYISIKESLLIWKRKLDWTMHIPFKRAKSGIECFLLCEAKTGYVYNFIIYTSKGTGRPIPINVADVDPTKHSHATNIVISLVENILDKGYFLSMNNYYSSVFLFDYLVSHKTDVIGTVRKNRKGLPKEVTAARLKKGEKVVRFRNKLMCMKWKHLKDTFVMSTIHDAEMNTVIARGGIKVQKPKAIIDFKDSMTDEDMMDQFFSATNTARMRIKKDYQKIYFRFLDMSVQNAYVLHKKLDGTLPFLQFKLKLITSLFEAYGNNTATHVMARKRSSKDHPPGRLTGHHYLEETPMSGSRHMRRHCVVCSAHKKRKLVGFLCAECKVSLCPTKCFRDYHTKQNFAE